MSVQATNNNIDPLKAAPRSLSPLPRKPSTPTKPKKPSSSPSSPGVRAGGVVKGAGAKPSRMGLAAGSLSAMMSEGYCLDGSSYAAYGADATGMYSQDLSTAAGQSYLVSMASAGMYGSPAVAAYYSSAAMSGAGSAAAAVAGYGYAGGAESFSMQLAATASGSFVAQLQQEQPQQQSMQQQSTQQQVQQQTPQQQQQQVSTTQQKQQQGATPMDVSSSAIGCGTSTPGFPANGVLSSAGGANCNTFDSMLPPADKCATGTPALSAPKAATMQHHSSPGCRGSPNDSDIYSPLMRFSIGDPENILPVEADHTDPIAAAMGIHWHRITSMDGTDFDSLLSDGGGELQAELQLNRMLAEYEPSVTSKPHSNAGSAGQCTDSPASAKPSAEHFAGCFSTQQHMELDMGNSAAAAAAAPRDVPESLSSAVKIDPAAAAAAAVTGPLPKIVRSTSNLQKASSSLGGIGQSMLTPAAVAGALAAGHMHPALHVDVPSPSVSCGAPSQQQQQHVKSEGAVSSPQGVPGGQLKLSSSGGNASSSGSPASAHLSSVNINLGLVNPAVAHLVAGGDRNATSAPCTMVAAYTPNGTYSPNPTLPRGAFTQGVPQRPHSPPNAWQHTAQQAHSTAQHVQQAHMQLGGLSAGQRPSPFNDLQHQQQQMQTHSNMDLWGAAMPTCHKQHSHLLAGLYSSTSTHQHMHIAHHQQQHMQSSSLMGSPATPAAASGAAAAVGPFSGPMRSAAWASSSAGCMPSSQQQQQQQSAAAVAAAAIHSTGRWSQHNEGPLPIDVTHEDEADLARLFEGEGDADVAMTNAPAVAESALGAPAAAAVQLTASTASVGVSVSPLMVSANAAVGAASAQDTAKLESLIQELQTGAVPDSRLGSAPLAEVAGDLMDLPAWGSSSSGSLDLLTGECW